MAFPTLATYFPELVRLRLLKLSVTLLPVTVTLGCGELPLLKLMLPGDAGGLALTLKESEISSPSEPNSWILGLRSEVPLLILPIIGLSNNNGNKIIRRHH